MFRRGPTMRLDSRPSPQRPAILSLRQVEHVPGPWRVVVSSIERALRSPPHQWRCLASTLVHDPPRCCAKPMTVNSSPITTMKVPRYPETCIVFGFSPNLARAGRRTLLDSAPIGPLDERVRDRIIAEARGNPQALRRSPRPNRPVTRCWYGGRPGTSQSARPCPTSTGSTGRPNPRSGPCAKDLKVFIRTNHRACPPHMQRLAGLTPGWLAAGRDAELGEDLLGLLFRRRNDRRGAGLPRFGHGRLHHPSQREPRLAVTGSPGYTCFSASSGPSHGYAGVRPGASSG